MAAGMAASMAAGMAVVPLCHSSAIGVRLSCEPRESRGARSDSSALQPSSTQPPAPRPSTQPAERSPLSRSLSWWCLPASVCPADNLFKFATLLDTLLTPFH
eukprot:CAMPEP_0181180592 /NCGR_PEP_ID=MMETSP1096-20121128/6883_1 /TAXON_ID=156174 ORGANISM="Chrysochromulina ericina, Strain CCMP281" /NCGR_SAMPLE_ID=MMETSP1096 /ASSEMBLY_ACC=CAM_ASM_000453 /LENGTH=101 /DNA_ID=CAMNT_0023269033 /DNA_START=498 /DNA_END=800 /DNA_ORIENTATION=-